MKKKVLFILDASNMGEVQATLIDGILKLTQKRILTPVFYIDGENKDLEKKLRDFSVRTWDKNLVIERGKGRIHALFKCLFNIGEITHLIKQEMPDMILSCDFRVLTFLSVFCQMSHTPLFWIQENLWDKKDKAASLLAGYTHSLLLIHEGIRPTLPAVLQKDARVLPPLDDKISPKTYAENVFKGCI